MPLKLRLQLRLLHGEQNSTQQKKLCNTLSIERFFYYYKIQNAITLHK